MGVVVNIPVGGGGGGGGRDRGWISSSDEHFYGHFCPLSPGLQSVERMGNDWVERPIPGSCPVLSF